MVSESSVEETARVGWNQVSKAWLGSSPCIRESAWSQRFISKWSILMK